MLNLKEFITPNQLRVMRLMESGEEGEFFTEKLAELITLISNMPKIYEQDGKGDEAIVTLHYFRGNADWYITEKDSVAGEPQLQAFGFADLGDPQNAELGYISIDDLIKNKVELDLYFTPRTLREVKKEKNYR